MSLKTRSGISGTQEKVLLEALPLKPFSDTFSVCLRFPKGSLVGPFFCHNKQNDICGTNFMPVKTRGEQTAVRFGYWTKPNRKPNRSVFGCPNRSVFGFSVFGFRLFFRFGYFSVFGSVNVRKWNVRTSDFGFWFFIFGLRTSVFGFRTSDFGLQRFP